jgi:hypothetical protein
MQIRSLINFGNALPVMTGVNVRLQDDGGLAISVAVLKREKDVVKQAFTTADLTSVEQLRQVLHEQVPAGARVHLNVEGRGVLSKFATPAADMRLDVLQKQLFPMIQEEDFVAQRYRSGAEHFVLIVRKDVLTALMPAFERHALISFSLGAFVVAPVLPLLPPGEFIELPHHTLQLRENRITAVHAHEAGTVTTFSLGEERVSSDIFLAYAGAWSLLLGHSDMDVAGWPALHENNDRYQRQAHLHTAGKWAMVALLVLLLVNMALNFWLQGANDEMELHAVQVTDRQQKNSREQHQQTSLTNFLEHAGWESNMLPLYYADQVGQLTGEGIELTSLEIGVIDDGILKSLRKHVYRPGVLRVKGLARDPLALQRMLQAFLQRPWVKAITEQRYQHDARSQKGVFEFYVQLP